MTESRFIPLFARRLAQPHRSNSLVQNDAKSRIGNAQASISKIHAGQSHSPTSWSSTFKTKIAISVAGTDPTDHALYP